MRVIRPLNYMAYNKAEAQAELRAKVGWSDYGRKHGESHFTKFFQNYYLPQRYNYDKRRHHLSSLIVSNQMTRGDALKELNCALYADGELDNDLNYICSKLEISRHYLDELMNIKKLDHCEFKNQQKIYRSMKFFQRLVEKDAGKKITAYS